MADRGAVLGYLSRAIPASQLTPDKRSLTGHNTGVYFQNVPTDPTTGRATFPYNIAEDQGYYKVDLIPYHVYEGVIDEDHLIELLAVAESDNYQWDWFLDDRFYTNEDSKLQVTHLARHMAVAEMYPPESVEDVAILIALIRPRKKYLIGEHWDIIEEKIWQKLPEEESDKPGNYFFKKSHAIAFALVILVHLQLIHKGCLQDLQQML